MGVAGLLFYRTLAVSPAERQARAYLLAARAYAGNWEKLAAELETDAVSFLLPVASGPSPFEMKLARAELRLANMLPQKFAGPLTERISRRLDNPDRMPASYALQVIASKPGGVDLFASYLKQRNPAFRRYAAGMVGQAAQTGHPQALAWLNQALARETDAQAGVFIAYGIAKVERTNTAALAFLRSARTNSAQTVTNLADHFLREIESNR